MSPALKPTAQAHKEVAQAGKDRAYYLGAWSLIKKYNLRDGFPFIVLGDCRNMRNVSKDFYDITSVVRIFQINSYSSQDDLS